MRRYNHPTKDVVAAVFVADDGAPPSRRDLVIWPRGDDSKPHRVDDGNEHVDPAVYTLLFPSGDLGWHPKLEHAPARATKGYTHITPMQFYSFKLMMRCPAQNPLPHRAGVLFQQYCVDTYCRAEARRLEYIRTRQRNLPPLLILLAFPTKRHVSIKRQVSAACFARCKSQQYSRRGTSLSRGKSQHHVLCTEAASIAQDVSLNCCVSEIAARRQASFKM